MVARGTGWAGSTLGLSARSRGKHNLGLLYYYWGVFTFLKRWVYIDLDRMSFLSVALLRRLKTGFQLLTGMILNDFS